MFLISLSQTSLSFQEAFTTWPLISDSTTFADTFSSAIMQTRDSAHAWWLMLVTVVAFTVLCTTLAYVPESVVVPAALNVPYSESSAGSANIIHGNL